MTPWIASTREAMNTMSTWAWVPDIGVVLAFRGRSFRS
jgi:hypothetical protein